MFVAILFTLSYFIFDDFTKYWVHRFMHKWPLLWALHKVHHSAETLNPITVYRTHPLEGVVFSIRGAFTQGIVISFFIYVFGNKVDLVTILGVNVFVFVFHMKFLYICFQSTNFVYQLNYLLLINNNTISWF